MADTAPKFSPDINLKNADKVQTQLKDIGEEATKLEGTFGKLGRALKAFGPLVQKAFVGFSALIGAQLLLESTNDAAKAVSDTLEALSSKQIGIDLLGALGDSDTVDRLNLISNALRLNGDAINGLVTKGTAEFKVFNNQLTRVTVISGQTNKELQDNLQKTADELKNVSSVADLVGSAYQAASAEFSDTADQATILTAAVKLNTIGFGDQTDTTEVLVKTLRAYNLTAGDSTKIASQLNEVVNKGITTLPQLSQGFGELAGSAKQAGISLEDSLALVSTLTTKGTSTPESFSGGQALIRSISDQNDERDKAIASLSVKTGKDLSLDLPTVKTEGFERVAKIVEAAKGDATILRKIFQDELAFKTAISIGGDTGKKFKSDKAAITKAGTEEGQSKFGADFNKVAEDDLTKVQRIANSLKDTFIKLGAVFADVFEGPLNNIKGFADLIKNIDPKVLGFFKNIGIGILIFKALTGALFAVGGGLVSIIAKFALLRVGFLPFLAGMKLLIPTLAEVRKGVALADTAFGKFGKQVSDAALAEGKFSGQTGAGQRIANVSKVIADTGRFGAAAPTKDDIDRKSKKTKFGTLRPVLDDEGKFQTDAKGEILRKFEGEKVLKDVVDTRGRKRKLQTGTLDESGNEVPLTREVVEKRKNKKTGEIEDVTVTRRGVLQELTEKQRNQELFKKDPSQRRGLIGRTLFGDTPIGVGGNITKQGGAAVKGLGRSALTLAGAEFKDSIVDPAKQIFSGLKNNLGKGVVSAFAGVADVATKFSIPLAIATTALFAITGVIDQASAGVKALGEVTKEVSDKFVKGGLTNETQIDTDPALKKARADAETGGLKIFTNAVGALAAPLTGIPLLLAKTADKGANIFDNLAISADFLTGKTANLANVSAFAEKQGKLQDEKTAKDAAAEKKGLVGTGVKDFQTINRKRLAGESLTGEEQKNILSDKERDVALNEGTLAELKKQLEGANKNNGEAQNLKVEIEAQERRTRALKEQLDITSRLLPLQERAAENKKLFGSGNNVFGEDVVNKKVSDQSITSIQKAQKTINDPKSGEKAITEAYETLDKERLNVIQRILKTATTSQGDAVENFDREVAKLGKDTILGQGLAPDIEQGRKTAIDADAERRRNEEVRVLEAQNALTATQLEAETQINQTRQAALKTSQEQLETAGEFAKAARVELTAAKENEASLAKQLQLREKIAETNLKKETKNLDIDINKQKQLLANTSISGAARTDAQRELSALQAQRDSLEASEKINAEQRSIQATEEKREAITRRITAQIKNDLAPTLEKLAGLTFDNLSDLTSKGLNSVNDALGSFSNAQKAQFSFRSTKQRSQGGEFSAAATDAAAVDAENAGLDQQLAVQTKLVDIEAQKEKFALKRLDIELFLTKLALDKEIREAKSRGENEKLVTTLQEQADSINTQRSGINDQLGLIEKTTALKKAGLQVDNASQKLGNVTGLLGSESFTVKSQASRQGEDLTSNLDKLKQQQSQRAQDLLGNTANLSNRLTATDVATNNFVQQQGITPPAQPPQLQRQDVPNNMATSMQDLGLTLQALNSNLSSMNLSQQTNGSNNPTQTIQISIEGTGKNPDGNFVEIEKATADKLFKTLINVLPIKK